MTEVEAGEERPQSPKSKEGQRKSTDETHQKHKNQNRPGGLGAVSWTTPAKVVGSGTVEEDRDQPEDTFEHKELERVVMTVTGLYSHLQELILVILRAYVGSGW